jgi:hypothetical protein
VDVAIGVVVAPQGRLVRGLRFTIANGKITEIEVIGDGNGTDQVSSGPY